jgi:predicted amidohydrolase
MSTLTITGIQTSLYWENPAANLKMFEEKIKSISDKTEIIILPEMFTTGFSMKPEELAETMPARSGTDGDGETVKWMKRIAAEKKVILTGSVIIGQAADSVPTRYFNRLIWMLPNGQYGVYDKRHLFAYAGEDEHYTPGAKRLIASVKGWKINLLICYDLRFPVWSRQAPPLREERGLGGEAERNPEYDLLIYVANWPERRIHAWKTLLLARAIENQCYVVGLNRVGKDGNDIYYNGSSMVVDPLGEVLYQKENAEDIFTITLQKEKLEEVRTKLPFWKDGDSFSIQP